MHIVKKEKIKEEKNPTKHQFGKAFLWVCLKENQAEIMSIKQFHVGKWDSSVKQSLNPSSNGEAVVLHGLSLDIPFRKVLDIPFRKVFQDFSTDLP